jgi:hypothetical protein
MSRTGYAPWDDDIGADQLERLMQTTKLPKVIRKMLAQINDAPKLNAFKISLSERHDPCHIFHSHCPHPALKYPKLIYRPRNN